ncbi:MAG: symmetrical bis(5'-nucleosyl)-tetraphosphatase [Gammaproteobacteria bacterium]
MAVYAIGDVQGCFDELQALLAHLDYEPAEDTLWFSGDLVNRGDKSLETLRFVYSLGERAVTVLGNHDLHLIVTAGGHRPCKGKDTLDAVLAAPDCDELVDWLRHRPLLHHDAGSGFTLLHAGLPPQWDLELARACAHEAESLLRGPDYREFLDKMYGNKPVQWDDALTGFDRTRFIVNCFTRLRYCTADGRLDLKSKGPPGSQPDGYLPWFEVPARKSRDMHIIFGHWSTLGKRNDPGIYPLDHGCLWGGELTALEVGPQPRYHSLNCPGQQKPKAFKKR